MQPIKKWKWHLVCAIATVLFALISFYFALPAIHPRSGGFWAWLLFSAAMYGAVYGIFALRQFHKNGGRLEVVLQKAPSPDQTKKLLRLLIPIAVGIVLLILLCVLFSSRLLFAKRYQAMLTVTDREFATDIAELTPSQIPVVDQDTAQRLSARKVGEVVDLVSQFNVADDFNTQINYHNVPYRVVPLQYASIIKWFTNHENGIPYYITIDMATQQTELVKLEQSMKYSPYEYFSRDLKRTLRFAHPTKMFEEAFFEIDENGHPYFGMAYYDYTIGLFGGKDIKGLLLLDAVTGEVSDYPVSTVPTWVDRVYSSSIVVQQADDWGSLTNGYLNTLFGQKNVITTTEGYNYIALDDDIWLYTGLTSVVSDESNVGFILINLRTKEARKYNINGAEEYSAMESAQGKVQEKRYNATFPILMNIEGVPSYFLSLKDDSGLVKSYAFVNVESYQIVGVGDTVTAARDEYLRLLNITPSAPPNQAVRYENKIVDGISQAVVAGNTVYYLKIGDSIFTASVTLSDQLPFLQLGDSITFDANADGELTAIIAILPPTPPQP